MRPIKHLLSAGLFGLGLLFSSGAQAQSFQLTMDCTDCAQTAGVASYTVQAELTLQNYTLGDPLDGTFVSFVYGGSNLVAPYSVTLSGNDGNPATTDYAINDTNVRFLGSVTNPNGANFLGIFFNYDKPSDTAFRFKTYSGGEWDTCAPNAQGGISGDANCTFTGFETTDYGTGATYSPAAAVPEPEQALLLGAGLLLIVGAVRRQRRS